MPTNVARDVIQCSLVAEEIIRSERTGAMWNQPSALAGWDVGALAGHLAQALFTAEQYATASAAKGAIIDAAHYVAMALSDDDPQDRRCRRQSRGRGAPESSHGVEDLVRRMQRSRAALLSSMSTHFVRQMRRSRATVASAMSTHDVLDRQVDVGNGQTMMVREYLKTRLVELVVHIDDLATSIGLDRATETPDSAYQTAAGILAEVAAVRSGGLATVRSLARGERHPDPVRAF